MNHSIIGITGSIGSGKSVVSRILRCNGFHVYDCDYEAKQLMVTSPQIREALIDCAGEETYHPDGTLNRYYLASCIFSDDSLRLRVNKIVHSAVRESLGYSFSSLKPKLANSKTTFQPYFIESAILATAELVGFCDSIWLIDAPRKVKIKRVMHRDNLSEEDVIVRLNVQAEELSLLPFSKTTTIINDGYTSLLATVFGLLNGESHSLSSYKMDNICIL